MFRVLGLVFAFFRFFQKLGGLPTSVRCFFSKFKGVVLWEAGVARRWPGGLRGNGRAPGNGRGDEAGAHCRSELIASGSAGGLVLQVGAGCGSGFFSGAGRLGK